MYLATLAPTVTFWDAGEFVAAVGSWGIPHPPGTPLYVTLARAWSELLGALPLALATNLLSAACTAAAGGVLAWLVARGTRDAAGGFAAALAAGATATVWSNATETEVYAASLLLAMAILAAADRLGRTRQGRWLVLAAYLVALAVPLHLSALVVVPGALVLAIEPEHASAGRRWWLALALGGAFVVAAGAGRGSAAVAAAGIAVLAFAAVVAPAGRRREVAWAAVMVAVALSALAIIPARAAHDPAIDAGHVTSWSDLWALVGRAQYGPQPLWPRKAPVWIQIANFFEYADWQFALGLHPDVGPAPTRTTITVLFAALGLYGGVVHHRLDRRSWRAFVVLLVGASLGLVAYMNFRAGASFGWGVLPPDALHEARDRDYFFSLAFWTWGAWAGLGAVAAARRLGGRRLVPAGVIVAAVPIVLNWRAVDRRRTPDAWTAHALGRALLWSAPGRGVLVTGGDNDSFPLWYAQVVDRWRPDVTVVVTPLLGAEWYRAQLARRDSLLGGAGVAAEPANGWELLREIARRAASRDRPVVIAATAGDDPRHVLGGEWVLSALVFVREGEARTRVSLDGLAADTMAAAAFVRRFDGKARPAERDGAIDYAPGYMAEVLRCPAWVLAAARREVPADSLAWRCKLR